MSINQQQAIKKKHLKNYPNYKCIKKNKLPGKKFNQGGKRLVHRKV